MKATDELRVSPCYYKHLEAWGIPDTEEGLVEFNGAGRTFHAYKNPTKLTPQQTTRQTVRYCVLRYSVISHTFSSSTGPLRPPKVYSTGKYGLLSSTFSNSILLPYILFF